MRLRLLDPRVPGDDMWGGGEFILHNRDVIDSLEMDRGIGYDIN